MPAEVRIKIVDESGPAPLTGTGTGGGGGSGASPPPPPAPPSGGAPDPGDPAPRQRTRARTRAAGDETDAEKEARERQERRIRRGEAWRKRKRREAWAERVNMRRKEAEDAKAEQERPEREARERSERRTARGMAWRRAKRLQGFRDRIQERRQLRQSALTAGMTAAGLQGGGLAGAGRAAGGTLGGVAGAALGPVGAIVGQAVGGAVGDAVGSAVSALARPFELVGRAAQFTARALDKVASNDGMGAVAAAGEGVASVLEKIPIAGDLLASNLRGLSAVVTSAKSALDSFAARGRELSGFSGDIAAAGARQDVARLLGDIREAQKMGAAYARAIDAQTRIEEAMRNGLMPLKEWILGILPGLLDLIIENTGKGALAATRFMGTGDGSLYKQILDALGEYRKSKSGGSSGPTADDLILSWLRLPSGFGMLPAAPAPAATAPAGGLGIPLIPTP